MIIRTRKIVNDLLSNKTRTLLVVLTIALGVLAVGTISRTWVILSRELSATYLAANPASALLVTSKPFDEEMVQVIQKMPEVRVAEGRYNMRVRVLGGSGEWQALNLMVLPDDDDLRINKIQLEEGTWPPPKRTMLLERSSHPLINLKPLALGGRYIPPSDFIGTSLVIEMANGKQREIQLAGLVHDITVTPTTFSNLANGYITQETLERLNGVRGYNQLYFTVAEKADHEAHIQQVMEQVREKMEAAGLIITSKRIPEPGEHPLNNIIEALLFILAALGVLGLLLSALLVINTISSLLTQQVQEIGIMKAIGASRGSIMLMYLGMIFIFGALALLISLPVSQFAAYNLTQFLASLLNFDISNFDSSASVIALDFFAGLLVPLGVALIPIINGIQVTVREAISKVQGSNFGHSALDQLLNRVRILSVTLLYALRNTFRRKTRLALTLMTLALANAIFMAVLSVQGSLLITTNNVSDYWKEDVKVNLNQSYRITKMERAALSVPGTVDVEGRLVGEGVRIQPDGRESIHAFSALGLPATTPFLKPTILEGRWLHPEDQNAIVINVSFTEEIGEVGDEEEDEEALISLGEEIRLKISGQETTWQVVGIVTEQVTGSGGGLLSPIAYINYPYLARIMGEVGRGNRLAIQTEQHDLLFQTEVAHKLEDQFRNSGLHTQNTITYTQQRQTLQQVFGIILALMFVMTILFAIVGGLGLMSMMSLSVLERTKEIGILRITGGTGAMVIQIVMIEGIFIGLLSWSFACLLALPLSQFLSDAVGLVFIKTPLSYTFSINSIWLSLTLTIILSAIASVLPAFRASQITVYETLA